jgi:FkbM family methyltransferase
MTEGIDKQASETLAELMAALPELRAHHRRGGPLHNLFTRIARQEIERCYSAPEEAIVPLGPLGDIKLPYVKMGAVDSRNLFDLDELIIFSFYWQNRRLYRQVLDIGANLGLHSIVLAKCGFIVHAYEPDPNHFSVLEDNLALNECEHVTAFNAAVSSKIGSMEFVRVLGNTTSSHLAGSKANPYGDLERFNVNVEAISSLLVWADLIKMDAEGHEKEIIAGTTHDMWENTDAMIEVESEDNAKALYDHFQSIGVSMFAQKTGWQRVHSVNDVPTSYRQGSLFISCRESMPWP